MLPTTRQRDVAPAMLDAVKAGFNPAELRVPKGDGLGSGRWGDANGVQPVQVAARDTSVEEDHRRGDFDEFFDTLYPQIHTLAERLGIEESWILGLAAYESYWLGPHNRQLNNPFGVTHGGGPNARYDSISAAVD
jgi:hypothetical protein